jgi:hypothetical protein
MQKGRAFVSASSPPLLDAVYWIGVLPNAAHRIEVLHAQVGLLGEHCFEERPAPKRVARLGEHHWSNRVRAAEQYWAMADSLDSAIAQLEPWQLLSGKVA